MKFIGDRWLSSLLIGAALTLVVGVVMTATAPVACAQEEEGTESAPAAEETAAAESSGGDATAEALSSYIAESDYTINTLIMFICAVLVIFMQAGFAMVEIGLNSAKNAVNILSKNVMDRAV